jgi:hypothetical protein
VRLLASRNAPVGVPKRQARLCGRSQARCLLTFFPVPDAPLSKVFGNSPDETAYYRMALFRVSVPDAMVRMSRTPLWAAKHVCQRATLHAAQPPPCKRSTVREALRAALDPPARGSLFRTSHLPHNPPYSPPWGYGLPSSCLCRAHPRWRHPAGLAYRHCFALDATALSLPVLP